MTCVLSVGETKAKGTPCPCWSHANSDLFCSVLFDLSGNIQELFTHAQLHRLVHGGGRKQLAKRAA